MGVYMYVRKSQAKKLGIGNKLFTSVSTRQSHGVFYHPLV